VVGDLERERQLRGVNHVRALPPRRGGSNAERS
jgi:hypothetical protein